MSTITLAGKDYDIQDLPIKQVREIDWRFIRVAEAYYDRSKFTEQSRQDVFDIVYYALTHGNPTLARSEFEALEIPLTDALRAVGIIITQTHMFKPRTEATQQMGEAPPTGTP